MLPRIVLVETQGALNVGSIARVMMNFGFNNLILVNPRCDPQSEDAFKMATHAKEILTNAKIVQSLENALQDCTRVVATTAQERHRNRQLEGPELAFKWLALSISARNMDQFHVNAHKLTILQSLHNHILFQLPDFSKAGSQACLGTWLQYLIYHIF